MHKKSDAPVCKIFVLLLIAAKSKLLKHFFGLSKVGLTVRVANFIFVLDSDFNVKKFDDFGTFAII